ncbi:MAG: DUF4276 family protein [Bacteroidetes bacterium]|nr:MAG: DUF4276 family protein [Bacteroidota bacterium]TAG90553.1 MAG: DUF4276 family protein [Bacteroidota bacterium]
MARQIFIGLMTEGTTDQRFLKSIVERTFNEIKIECHNDIEIFDVELIEVSENKFVEQVLEASKKGFDEFGMTILCVHTDAEKQGIEYINQYKIKPAQEVLDRQKDTEYCKILVAITPLQEIESWMLSDKELLKKEIGTTKSDNDLGINKKAEETTNPKEIIENAIKIARENLTKKRRSNLTIAELYLPIGQKIELEKLDTLVSYQNFKENIREAFRKLKLLH